MVPHGIWKRLARAQLRWCRLNSFALLAFAGNHGHQLSLQWDGLHPIIIERRARVPLPAHAFTERSNVRRVMPAVPGVERQVPFERHFAQFRMAELPGAIRRG